MATIVTRSGKGSALTHAEMDANFNNLNGDKVETSLITQSSTDTTAGRLIKVGDTGTAQFPLLAPISKIGAMSPQSVVSANTTLSESAHGNTVIVNTASGITISMPAPNTVSSGTVFEIHGESYTLNMNGNSTDNGSSFSVSSGEVFRLVSDGGSFYRTIRGSINSGVAPNKLDETSHSYGVIYQADVNRYLQIWLQGAYMNSARLTSGSTTALGDTIAKAGNDLNANTWSQSITAIIPAGYYFRLENDPGVASGHLWEVISMRSYPLI